MPLLSELCSIQSGYSFRGRLDDTPNGRWAVVQLGDVDWDTGQIAWSELIRVDGVSPGPHHRLRNGDVLVAAKGGENGAILVAGADEAEALAAPTFFVLRPAGDHVLPEYVAWYLGMPEAATHLRAAAQGTNLRTILKADLGSMSVPLPSLETQHRITTMARLQREERMLTELLMAKRAQFVEAACLHLLRTSPSSSRQSASRQHTMQQRAPERTASSPTTLPQHAMP